ncbi:MAG TPA: aldehyde dehydrogenase family protein, partial [Terriglobales bacterium]|nr:aldehyde dehydrogenase family protein [Terriglobales bacterium]
MAATLETIPAVSLRSPRGEFRNTAHLDFKSEENAREMREALRQVHAQLGTEYDLVIGGEMVRTRDKIKSLNPAKPSELIGIHQKAGAEHVEAAMQAALKAFESWRATSWEERASLLLNASAIIQSRRLEFNAWMVYEVGKNWVEADADTAETIDFLEFY